MLIIHFNLLSSPAVLYPAIPEDQMDAIMKAGEAIQARTANIRHQEDENEEPLKLKSISELTPQDRIS